MVAFISGAYHTDHAGIMWFIYLVKHLQYIWEYAFTFRSSLIPGRAHRWSIPRLYSRAHGGACSHVIPPSPWLQYTHRDETRKPLEGQVATAHVVHSIIPSAETRAIPRNETSMSMRPAQDRRIPIPTHIRQWASSDSARDDVIPFTPCITQKDHFSYVHTYISMRPIPKPISLLPLSPIYSVVICEISLNLIC